MPCMIPLRTWETLYVVAHTKWVLCVDISHKTKDSPLCLWSYGPWAQGCFLLNRSAVRKGVCILNKRFNWLSSPHYKIERFGIMFTGLMLCMCVLMGSVMHHKSVVDANRLGDQVQYTTETTMSLSGNKATVEGIYLDSDQTEAFVLLKWEDPSILVSNANEYRMFVTGVDTRGIYTDLYSHPMGSIYMFGSTGYMGLYLTDAARFPTQVISVIVRCASTMYTQPNVPTYSDSSFNDYDQFEIRFNPGAAGFEPAAFLDEDRMSLYDIYEGTVIAGKEDVIKETLESDLAQMDTTLTQINQFVERIESTTTENGFVIVPDAPMPIRGDKIETDENGNKRLVTVTDLAGGFDFDWRNLSLRTGYLDSVVPEGMTATKWLQLQVDAAEQTATVGINVDKLSWYWSDGTKYTGANKLEQDRLDRIASDIASLKQAWMEYYRLKFDYQITQQYALLQLELNARDVIQSYTINSDDVVTIW